MVTPTAGGRFGTVGGAPFKGVLDEAAVYATALPASRIAAHYAAGIPTSGPPSISDPVGLDGTIIRIDPSTGAVWRVEWIYAPAVGAPSGLRVEFDTNAKLGMLVPLEMREDFRSFGGIEAYGSGVAQYSNFRRFGTGARIVPQQP